MTFDTDAIVAALTEDGDKYEDGEWRFKLRIEPDDDLTVDDMEDPEVFGRYEFREYGRDNRDRPDGFTGAAVKLASETSQGVYYWYEPPKDFRKFKGSGFTDINAWENAKEANLRYVRRILSYGYSSLGIIATHTRSDGYERTWSEWIGGTDFGEWPESKAYIAEMVGDVLGELLAQIEQEATCPT